MKKSKRKSERPVQAASQVRASGPKVWHYAVGLLGAFLIGLQAYGPALRGPFLYDDIYLPYNNPALADQPLKAWLMGVRPLLMFSFWLNFRLSGLQPFSYHFFNYLVHFGCSLFAYLIVRRILSWSGTVGWRREALSIFGGMLFLLHPVQTESVSYIASRSECLSVFLFYAAFTLFVYRRSSAVSWPVSIGVLALFVGAVSSKEHAAVFPALLLLTDYFWNPGFSLKGIKRNWRLYIPIGVGGILAARAVLRVLRSSDTAGFGLTQLPWYQYFFTQCRAIWSYIRLFLFPYGQTIDHDFATSRTLLEHGAIFGLLGLIGLAALAVVFRKRYPLLAYGYFAFLLLLAPTSSVVPILDTLVEHRLYLPMLALAIMAAGALDLWKAKPATFVIALSAILVIFGVLTHNRNRLWGNEIAFWEDAVAKTPGKSRPRFQLAYAYFTNGRCDAALRQYTKVAEMMKPDTRLLIDWGLAYECENQPEQAIAKLKQAAAIEKSAIVYANMGMVYAKRGRNAEALEVLKIAAELDPNFDMTYLYRGNIYVITNQFQAAVNEYRRALELNPGNNGARSGLALAETRLRMPR